MGILISFLKRASLLALAAMPLCAAGNTDIREFKFAPEFFDELRSANIQNLEFRMKFYNNSEEAVFGENVHQMRSFSCNVDWIRKFKTKFTATNETGDSLSVYYCLASEYILLEKGYVKVAKKDVEDGVLTINPLTQCKKVVVKSSIGVDGVPLSTNVKFLGYHDFQKNTFIFSANCRYGIPLLQKKGNGADDVQPQMMTSAFWTDPGRELPYMVYTAGPYFMKNGIYTMTDAEVPDTIALDYREAKKVKFGVKRLNGKLLDLRGRMGSDHFSFGTFQTKFSTGNTLHDENNTTLIGEIMQDVAFGQPIYTLDFYAFPGEYIFTYWDVFGSEDSKNKLCPNGLEGKLVVGDEPEQRIDYDFSRYLTLTMKSNVAAEFKGLSYLAKSNTKSQNGNALLSSFQFIEKNHMCEAFTKIGEQGEGEFEVKIWPAWGYDLVDILGKVHDYTCSLKDVDMNLQKKVNIDVPDMYNVDVSFPAHLRHQDAQIRIGDEAYTLGRWEEDYKIPWGTFEDMDTISVYQTEGHKNVAYEISGFRGEVAYTSDVKSLNVGAVDTLHVEFPWSKVVIFEENRQEESLRYVFPDNVKCFYLGETYYNEECKEKYYVFEKTGDYSLDLCKTNSFTVPQKEEITVTKDISRYKFKIEGYKDFVLRVGENGGEVDILKMKWEGLDGRSVVFDRAFGINKKYPRTVSGPEGWIDIWVESFIYPRPKCLVAQYLYHIDMRGAEEFVVPSVFTNVAFVRGEEKVPLYRMMLHDDEKMEGEVKLYMLKSPNVDALTPLTIVEREALTDSLNEVELTAGYYLAVDGQNHKIYFEVLDGQETPVRLDFNNPPTPPVGIEEMMEEAEMPEVYYDLSGRRLDVPRKGVNLIRLQNGKVKKVMMK